MPLTLCTRAYVTKIPHLFKCFITFPGHVRYDMTFLHVILKRIRLNISLFRSVCVREGVFVQIIAFSIPLTHDA